MRIAVLAMGLLASAGAAAAQEGVNAPCVNQVNGAYDAVASADWQRHFAASDPAALQRVAGVWYTEIPNPQLNMIAYIYESFQPNQIFDYRSRTCGITCSDAYGTGMFAASTQPDGSIFITTNVSDNNRRNACGGVYVRFTDPNTMVGSDGTTLRRVQ